MLLKALNAFKCALPLALKGSGGALKLPDRAGKFLPLSAKRKGEYYPVHQEKVPTSTANAPAELGAATLRGKEAKTGRKLCTFTPTGKRKGATDGERRALD